MAQFYRILIGIFFVSFLTSASAFAIHGYPGYCIKSNGDTVKGFFPNYTQWLYNPSKVDFTTSASPDVIIVTPAEYKMFVVDNFEKYISYKGPRLVNAVDAGAASKSLDNNSSRFDTVVCFLRSIAVADNYEFFVFTDRLRVNFYYSLNGSTPGELIYKMYTENNQVKEDSYYKEQLFSVFSQKTDTAYLNSLLLKTKYKEESIVSFIEKAKSGGSGKQGAESMTGFIIEAGVAFNSYSVSGTNTIPSVATSYESNTSAVAGIGYIFPINRDYHRYFLYPQMKFYSYENTGSLTRNTEKYTTTFKTDLTVSLAVNVGYHLIDKEKINFYLAPGIGVLGMINNKMIYETEAANGDYSSSVETNENDVAFNLNITAGFIFSKRYVLWGSYNVPSATVSYQYFTGYHTSIQTGIGYKF